ncbi:MAG: hypothetical protein C0592_04510 [Marinilabiliales bacterium]|nr:MAG: hypothetical protein C0592_04510 [Marinilabiliales bacterium]
MNIETYREYCMAKAGVTEEFPFDDVTLVFKVGGKMFALTGLNHDFAITLKCDPEYAVELREKYPNIEGAYHMNKMHWITVSDVEQFDDKLLKILIDGSYELVYKSLTKKVAATIRR